MAITLVPSVVTGQTYSAANFNTHIRDNINGIWVLTTAGDMLYATGASAAARLALVPGGVMYGDAGAPAWLAPSTKGRSLRMGTTYPEWKGYIAGKASRSSNQNINSLTPTNIQFSATDFSQEVTWSSGDNTKLTIGFGGLYLIGFRFSVDGGTGYREVNILKNGGGSILNKRMATADGETTYDGLSDPQVLATGDYLQMQFTHSNGGAVDVRSASLFAIFLGVP